MKNLRPVTGDAAPEFQVFDSEGETFRLSEKTGNNRNIMMLLYRGHW